MTPADDLPPPPTNTPLPPFYAPATNPTYAVPNAAPARENGPALAALITNIIALIIGWIPFFGVLGLIAAIVGVVLGHQGLRRAQTLPEATSRKGMAIAALVIGYLAIAIALIVNTVITIAIINLLHTCQVTPADCG
jgi:hypothetical protein